MAILPLLFSQQHTYNLLLCFLIALGRGLREKMHLLEMLKKHPYDFCKQWEYTALKAASRNFDFSENCVNKSSSHLTAHYRLYSLENNRKHTILCTSYVTLSFFMFAFIVFRGIEFRISRSYHIACRPSWCHISLICSTHERKPLYIMDFWFAVCSTFMAYATILLGEDILYYAM